MATVFIECVGGTLVMLGYTSALSSPGFAQIIPDASLNTENSVITPGVTVQELPADLIEGGASRGTNLFHSFEDFNVNTGQRVYFANPVGIENILSRVTGGNISNIDGLLGVDGSANLFLLNPNGVIFGPNAQLDISGSFVTSTASSFTFADSSEFAALPSGNELLTVSVPIGVRYGVNPGSITNQGALRVGQDLTFAAGSINNNALIETERGNLLMEAIAGDVVLDGATFAAGNATIQASNNVEVATGILAADGQLVVQANQAIDIDGVVDSGQDMIFRAPERRLGNGIFVTSGYFTTEDLNGNLVDFLIPHERIIVADGNVQFDQNYSGPSLHILAGGNVTTTAAATAIEITGNGNGQVTATIGDGLGGTQQVTVFESNRPILDIRSGVDLTKIPGLVVNNAAIDGITTTDTPTGADIRLGVSEPSGFTEALLTNNGGAVRLTNQFHPNPSSVAGIIETGTILTFANGNGSVNGGNISLDGQSDITINGVLVTSSGVGGTAGTVDIASQSGDINVESIVSTSGNSGTGGAVAIASQAGDIDIGSVFSSSGNNGTGGAVAIASQSGEINVGAVRSSIGNNGSSGAISITSDSGNITTNEDLASQSGDAGISGAIAVSSRSGNITTNGFLDSFTGTGGTSGAISISSLFGDITTNGSLRASSESGNAGAIAITSQSGDITVNSGRVNTFANEGGQGGDILITSQSGDITTEGIFSSASFSTTGGNAGPGGNIVVSSQSGNIVLNTLRLFSGSFTSSGDASKGGDIVISSQLGNVSTPNNEFLFSASLSASGNAGTGGNITLTAPNGRLQGDGTSLLAFSIAETADQAAGAGGTVTLEARDVISGFDVSTLSSSEASGSIGIQGFQDLLVEDTNLITSGQIQVPIPFFGGVTLDTSTFGQAGATSITSTGNITLSNVQVLSDANGPNPAGAITISSPGDVTLTNSEINVNTNDTGAAGDIAITAGGGLTIQGTGGIFARTNNADVANPGEGGDITVNTPLVTLAAGATIEASTASGAAGGNLILNAPEDLTIQGAGQITVDTTSSGRAGNLDVNAPQVAIDGTQLSASTSGSGQGGDVVLTTDQISLANGGQIAASTSSNGAGGNVAINASQLRVNTGAIAASTSGSGQGGNLTVSNDGPLIIQGNGQLTVGAIAETSGRAGNLDVVASTLTLEGVELSANSNSEQGGGDITIAAENTVFMSGGSFINAASNNENAGDGGNITIAIDDGFLIAAPGENNDIIANAVGGNGGNINVTALDILGLTEQDESDTDLLRTNSTNDISASSEFGFNGLVVLNTLDVDPARGLAELPTDLTDRSNQIVASCGLSNTGSRSEFVITGRGGLPASPDDLGIADGIIIPWANPDGEIPTAIVNPSTSEAGPPLVEAQDMVIETNGTIHLLAAVDTMTTQHARSATARLCAAEIHP